MGGAPATAAVEGLRDELRLAREALARLEREVAGALRSAGDRTPDTLTVYGSAALVHGFFTAIERFLQAVARDFNAEPPAGPHWHRRLLLAASSDRPGRRPPVLGEATATALDRYLRFRHLFRNLYVFELTWDELLPLLQGLARTRSLVEADLEAFDDFLLALVEPDG